MENRTVIDVTVLPRSSKSLVMAEADSLRIKLNSPPVDGKANEECIRLLSKTLGIPKSALTIVSGEKSRHKRIAVEGLSREQVFASVRSL